MRCVWALAIALVVASCGGSSGTTRQDWVKAADAICARYGPRIAALGPMPTGNRAIAAHLRANLALTRPELAEVAALPRPDGADATAIKATVAARDRALRALAAAAAAARRGSDPSLQLARAGTFAKQARAAAADLGLKVCGVPSPAPRPAI